MLGLAAATWLLLVPVPVWAWGLAIGAVGVASGLFFPRFFAGVTAGTPVALRARVLTSVTIVISALGPVGFLGAGLFASHSTVASRLLIAVSATLGALIVLAGHRMSTHDGGAPEGSREPHLMTSDYAAAP